MSEFALASFFGGQRLKIGQQFCRPVIAGRIATFDFLLDLAPDSCTTLLENLEPGAARLLGFLNLAAPFGFATLCMATFARIRNLPGPQAQCTDRTMCRGC